MTTHTLKIEKRWLDRIRAGEKTCEIRYNDRDFQVGDFLEFMYYVDPNEPRCDATHYQGDYALDLNAYEITHVLHFPEGLKEGYVALSIQKHEGLKVNPPR